MNRRDFLKAVGVGSTALVLPNIVVAEPHIPQEVFPTGLPALDRALNGGFRPGQLAVVLGTRGIGKKAFCNKVFCANQQFCATWNRPLHKHEQIATKFGYLGEGGNNLLHLHSRYKFMVANVDVTPIAQTFSDHKPWEKNYLLSRHFRQHAMNNSEAIVWTVPTNRSGYRIKNIGNTDGWNLACDNPQDYSIMRSADFVIVIYGKKLHLLKNRYGCQATIPFNIL
jgi:hypothetical protein